jgi:predicted RNA-binding Zn ribbon-like protein
MNFSHYSDRPVELAADLVNTRQPDHDALADSDQLEAFLDGYRDLWKDVAKPAQPSELPKIRELRDSLRAVFEAPDHATAAAGINVILNDHGAVPRVSVHSGEPHLHFEPLQGSLTAWLGATTAMGLATVLIDHGVERFGVCNAGDCDDVFVDSSRNRSRLHCSTTCSTREAVASYRRRQAE